MQCEKSHSDYWTWKENEYRFDIYPCSVEPENKKVVQVYALILKKIQDSILCLSYKICLKI
jgi:hypothetical protein